MSKLNTNFYPQTQYPNTQHKYQSIQKNQFDTDKRSNNTNTKFQRYSKNIPLVDQLLRETQ